MWLMWLIQGAIRCTPFTYVYYRGIYGVFNLGILGDYNLPIHTHVSKKAYITAFPIFRGTVGSGAPILAEVPWLMLQKLLTKRFQILLRKECLSPMIYMLLMKEIRLTCYLWNLYEHWDILHINWCIRWWFQICFIFIPIWGFMIQFDEHIFQMGGSTTN